MTVFQNSLGVWVVHDGTGYRYFQSEQEARQAMAALNVSEQPLEMEFVQAIVGEFLPNLRNDGDYSGGWLTIQVEGAIIRIQEHTPER